MCSDGITNAHTHTHRMFMVMFNTTVLMTEQRWKYDVKTKSNKLGL
jgi:hypothetical protein